MAQRNVIEQAQKSVASETVTVVRIRRLEAEWGSVSKLRLGPNPPQLESVVLIWLEEHGAGEPAPHNSLRSFLCIHELTAFSKGKMVMTNDHLDLTAAFIDDIEKKIAALQAVLLSLKSASAIGALSAAIEGGDLSVGAFSNGTQPIDLPEGAYNGKSLPQCVKLYLSTAKRKKTVQEIAAALHDGGVESTSPNFEGVVYGALFRLKATGEVLRFKDGWGLPEWYPANIRSSAPSTPTKRSKNKKKSKKSKAADPKSKKGKEQKSDNITEMTKPEEKTEPRIIGFLRANHREASAKEIANALGIKIQTTHLVLGKLVHQKKLERLDSGNFKVAS